MTTYRVHLQNVVTTVVTVEADSPDEAIDRAFESDDMPGSITVGAFGCDSVDDGEWMPCAVYDDASDEEVWSDEH